jgi:hypothetical protein
LDNTIDALMPDWPPLPSVERTQVRENCIGFVRAQLRLAPLHIQTGFWVLFAFYSFYTLLRAGPSPDRRRRAAALTAFSALRLPMVGGVERLLRAATMLAFFDDPLVLAMMGEETPDMRQQTFRAIRAQALP